LTEQLNDNSKSLDLRLMILEGKKLPNQTDLVGNNLTAEIPMSTSERAIQKEAKLIAEKEKGKCDRTKEKLQSESERVEIRKNSQPVEKPKANAKAQQKTLSIGSKISHFK